MAAAEHTSCSLEEKEAIKIGVSAFLFLLFNEFPSDTSRYFDLERPQCFSRKSANVRVVKVRKTPPTVKGQIRPSKARDLCGQ